MTTDNPYAAPQADLTDRRDPSGGLELATRGSRFAAATVDGVIAMIYFLPVAYATGVLGYEGGDETSLLRGSIIVSVVGLLAFTMIHGYFLKMNGQTVGKKLLGIRTTDLNGAVPDLWTLILRRHLPIALVTYVPVVGTYLPFLDILSIFRDDRRCVHDLIAGTRVVKTKASGNYEDRVDRSSDSMDWMFKDRSQSSQSLQSITDLFSGTGPGRRRMLRGGRVPPSEARTLGVRG